MNGFACLAFFLFVSLNRNRGAKPTDSLQYFAYKYLFTFVSRFNCCCEYTLSIQIGIRFAASGRDGWHVLQQSHHLLLRRPLY